MNGHSISCLTRGSRYGCVNETFPTFPFWPSVGHDVPVPTDEPSAPQRDERDRTADQNDYVLRSVEERRVRFVQLWFTDVLGSLKSTRRSSTERMT